MESSRILPVIALFSFVAACGEPPPPPREFDGPSAFRYIEQQVAFGPRIPGTEHHRRMGDWLDSLLRQRADTVVVQAWTHTTASGQALPLRNFLARYKPAEPRRILLVAHWDTRPRADGPASRDSTAPVPGANDGGSGVAVLLGVADVLKKAPPEIGVDLLFVDGEDYGAFDDTRADVLIGARYYAQHPPSGPRPEFAVLFDIVADRDLQIYQEGNSLIGAPRVVEWVWNLAAAMGYGQYFIASPRYTLTDDHIELQKAGIPAIDVIDFDYGPDNSWWHTTDDTVDKLSAASLKAVGDVAVGIVRAAPRF